MKNIVTRSLSGIVYVAAIIGALLAGPYWFGGLMAVFTVVAMLEFQHLLGMGNNPTVISTLIRILDIAAALSLCLTAYGGELAQIFFAVLILTAYMAIRIVLALYDRRHDAFRHTAMSVLSVLYIGLAIDALNFLAFNPLLQGVAGWQLVLTVFIMIWLNDTGAFCVGSLIGRHRLFERLSPKKSWEGFWGGFVFCLVAGAAAEWVFGGPSLIMWIGLGAVVSIFATWGDLFESLIKRTLGVKDSGHIIPGHGGILDRIDSLLLVAPAVTLYLFFLPF